MNMKVACIHCLYPVLGKVQGCNRKATERICFKCWHSDFVFSSRIYLRGFYGGLDNSTFPLQSLKFFEYSDWYVSLRQALS